MGQVKIKELLTQMMKPRLWGLFKTKESFVKMTSIMRIVRVRKTRWLDHVNRFVNSTMKKGNIDI